MEKHHIDYWPLSSVSTLWLWVDSFGKDLEPGQDNSSKKFSYNTEEWDAEIVVAIASVTYVLCTVVILASSMSWGTGTETRGAPWRMSSYHSLEIQLGCHHPLVPSLRRVRPVLHFLNSWLTVQFVHSGQGLYCVQGFCADWLLAWAQPWVQLHPVVHLKFMKIISPLADIKGAVFLYVGAMAHLIPFYMPLLFPLLAAVCMDVQSWGQ